MDDDENFLADTRAAVRVMRHSAMAFQLSILATGAAVAITAAAVAVIGGFYRAPSGMWPPAAAVLLLPAALAAWMGYVSAYIWFTGTRPDSVATFDRSARFLNRNIGRRPWRICQPALVFRGRRRR